MADLNQKIRELSNNTIADLRRSNTHLNFDVELTVDMLEYWMNRCAAAETLINAIDCMQYVTNEEQANAFLRWQNELRKVGELNTEPKH